MVLANTVDPENTGHFNNVISVQYATASEQCVVNIVNPMKRSPDIVLLGCIFRRRSNEKERLASDDPREDTHRAAQEDQLADAGEEIFVFMRNKEISS